MIPWFAVYNRVSLAVVQSVEDVLCCEEIMATSAIAPPIQHNLPLQAGERMDQPTFHARYEAMALGTRAELIQGVVHMPAALKRPHSRHHAQFVMWMTLYESETPGVEAHDNATAILSESSEPQPDGFLMISPEFGGSASVNERDYIIGAPEFVGEISDSSAAIDLGAKKQDYEAAGVAEYVVLDIAQRQVLWFFSREGKYETVEPANDGIFRSAVFPGLWLDSEAWVGLDAKRMRRVLQQGLDSAEHDDFVQKLSAAKRDDG